MSAGANEPSDAAPQRPDEVRVLVVDDHKQFRRAMRELIDATAGCRLVGEAACGEDAITEVSELKPRLVIMDKRMPGIGGVEATRVLTSRHPGLIVLLVSVEDPDARLAPSCGAAAVVRKQELSTQVLRDLLQRRLQSERA